MTSFSDFVIGYGAFPSAANGSIDGTITDSSGAPIAGATINLSGTQNRETITDAQGKYSFDSVETNGFYTVTPSRANYSFNPPNRSFSALGVHTEASFTASATRASCSTVGVRRRRSSCSTAACTRSSTAVYEIIISRNAAGQTSIPPGRDDLRRRGTFEHL